MTKDELNLLTQIYNTLTLVSTRGEDTIIMGDCLKAFQEFLFSQNGQKAQEG